jgi:hypothetical protein
MTFNFDWAWVVRCHEIATGWSERGSDTRFLVIADPTGRETQPLREYPGLFRDFASLHGDEPGILTFANQHGLLGVSSDLFVRTTSGDGWGESVRRWRAEVRLMRSAVRLWDSRHDDAAWVRATEDLAEAEDDLAWLDEPRRHPRPEEIRADSTLAMQAIEGSNLDRGLFFLCAVANRALDSHVSAALGMSPRRGRLAWTFQPDCLRTAMWLQFTMEVTRKVGYRKCETCGLYFEVSTEPMTGRRNNRRYCTEACKARAYRDRQKAAGN